MDISYKNLGEPDQRIQILFLITDTKVKWLLPSSSASGACPSPRPPLLCSQSNPDALVPEETFSFWEVQCPGSSRVNEVSTDSTWVFKAWSQSNVLTRRGRIRCQTACLQFVLVPHHTFVDLRTTDLCYVIIITSNVHPNLWFIFCAWKQSLYLTIPTHKTIHCYNLYGHKTLMIFCRPSKCF